MQNRNNELYILAVAQCFTSMGFSIIFPFLPLYIGELNTITNLNKATLSGLVFSAQAVSMMMISPFWGAIADRYGKKPMVIRAMTGGAITIFMMGFVHTAEVLIALRILQGLLSGVVSATSALAVSISSEENKGYSLGLLQTGIGMGVSLGPLLGGVLADTFGFRSTFVITSVLLFLSGMTVLFFVKEEVVTPGKMSVHNRFIKQWKAIILNRKLSAAFGLRFINSIASTILLPVIPLFIETIIQKKEKTGTMTGLVLGSTSVASIIGSLILTRIGDKKGHHHLVLTGSILAAFFFIPQYFAHSLWVLVALNIGTGFCIGALTPSLSALLATNSPKGTEGSIYGLDNSVVSAGRAIAPLLAALVAVQLDYRAIFIVAAVMFILMAIATGNIFFEKGKLVRH
ncbi:MAG: multidrug efflux MFS transporter [Fibrobacter sp.]|nr:multidrug efflux MFS transporter [Fibrobacter sp.]